MAKRSKNRKRSAEKVPGETPSRAAVCAGPAANLRASILQALVIVAAILWIYWPVLHGAWLMDDDVYLTGNPLMTQGDRLWKAWFEPGSFIEYYPLEETVQWIEWRYFGTDTFGYHLVNVLLHITGALLVWRLLAKLGLSRAWLGGLIFAIHPVQVESVAWISELKNTLSLPPLLLAMGAWIDFENHRRPRDYVLALGLFLVAMLCKISMATFPLVLLLYAWWKRGRIDGRDLKLSMPFFVISLTLGLTNIHAGNWYFQTRHAFPDVIPLDGIFARMVCAGLALSFYFSKCVLPVEMLPTYTQWPVQPPGLLQFLPLFILVVVVFILWKERARWGRHVLLGLGFFIILLLPFLGFTTISYMRFAWVMDHFLYIPIIGLIGLFIAGLGPLEKQLSPAVRLSAAIFGVAILTVLTVGSREYAGLFVDQETLWNYDVKENPGAWMARNNLGIILADKGQLFEAREQYEKALQVQPENAALHNDLAADLLKMGLIPEAMAECRHALRIDPGYAVAHYNLGNALSQANQISEATREYEQALQLNPDYAAPHNNLGLVLYKEGRVRESIEQFRQTLQLDPNDDAARTNLEKLEALPESERAK